MRNSVGQNVLGYVALCERQQLAATVAGRASDKPATRGRRLAEAGFWRADLEGELKLALEAYYESNRGRAERGKCKTQCDLVSQPNGLEVCRHTGQRCERQRLAPLLEAYGKLNVD